MSRGLKHVIYFLDREILFLVTYIWLFGLFSSSALNLFSQV